jgi:hypothetical protein
MPPRRLVLAFVAFWLTLGIALFAASARTLVSALSSPPHSHLALLAGLEGVAAALFVIPRTLRLGGFGLLAALAIALIAHGMNGEIPWLLLPCAAGTAFVLVHGPVPWSWLRARDSSA